MYDIALSVAACVRSGTRADVAWMLSPIASEEAIAFTPGGGRIGSLCGGAFDGVLGDVAARQLPSGRLVQHSVTELESAMSGFPAGTSVEFLVVPAERFPEGLWQMLVQRSTVAIATAVADVDVVGVTIAEVEATSCSVERVGDEVITVIAPVVKLVVAGQGPIAEALAAQARLLGWNVAVDASPDRVFGLTATLSPLDAVVVMGHDVESSSRNLMAALESDAGYIGALGSRQMQSARADWLAYRDVTDLSRVNGPAGLDIGAASPAEIAVSITAQIIAQR